MGQQKKSLAADQFVQSGKKVPRARVKQGVFKRNKPGMSTKKKKITFLGPECSLPQIYLLINFKAFMIIEQ